MPFVEMPEELAEDLANDLGIYGVHGEDCEMGDKWCRMCWVSNMTNRIRQAGDREREFEQGGRART